MLRDIRASEAACRASDGQVSKEEFRKLSYIPPSALSPLPSQRGGRRNVKIADQPEDVFRTLGREYAILRPALKRVRKDAKLYYGKNKSNWRSHLLLDYPVLNGHPDILEKMEKVYFGSPSDRDASGTLLDPWEVAIEISARRVIPGYKPFDASADTLRIHAIRPKSN